MSLNVSGTICTQLFPMCRRHFSTSAQGHFFSIKKTPSLEDVDASCVLQQSHHCTSKKGIEYEIVLDFSVFPRRNTYKGRDIIQKKLEIDPHFRMQVERMKKLVNEKFDKLCSFDPNDRGDPEWYLKHSLILNLIDKEPLIAKNGKRFECNAWVHNHCRQAHADQSKDSEEKLQTVQITDANKLQEVPVEAAYENMLPCFHPFVILPSWLKEYPDTSLLFNKYAWKHPSKSRYEISLWVHSISEDINNKGIKDLFQRIQAAGQPLKDKTKGLKELAAVRLSQVIEQRKPPICISAVKAAMIAEGALPLCSDVYITKHDIFEISAHVSKQPEQEAMEVNEALKNSFKKCPSQDTAFPSQYAAFNGMLFFYRPLVGPAPDNVMEGVMFVDKRVEKTKDLIKRADEGCRFAREELGWLAEWERSTNKGSREKI